MIYLDHAATSHPKPAAVIAAVQRWYEEVGVSPERGDGPATRDASATMRRCRERLGRRTGHSPDRVAFCSGATEGLNLTLRALAGQGARVATTCFEHSSVVRTLHGLRKDRGVQISKAKSTAELCAVLRTSKPDLAVMTHASNVTGEIFDAAAVAETARALGIPFVLDASQSAGYLPLDVGASVVVASAHKALHGPPGLGFISVDDDQAMLPQKFGGTGSSTALEHHPVKWPQAFEAGTPNMPAIYGLDAALTWLDEAGEAVLLRRARAALARLRRRLEATNDFVVHAAPAGEGLPVMSLCHARYDPLEMTAILAGAGVHARAGFHCAPWIHEHLGTQVAGTLRLSPGPATTDAELDEAGALLAAL